MKCPQCEKAGLTPEQIDDHGSMTTDMYFAPFYDSDGRKHHHDGNARSSNLQCSNGHRFVKSTPNTCWCGWTSHGGKPRASLMMVQPVAAIEVEREAAVSLPELLASHVYFAGLSR